MTGVASRDPPFPQLQIFLTTSANSRCAGNKPCDEGAGVPDLEDLLDLGGMPHSPWLEATEEGVFNPEGTPDEEPPPTPPPLTTLRTEVDGTTPSVSGGEDG